MDPSSFSSSSFTSFSSYQSSIMAAQPSTCKPIHDPVSMSLSIFLSFGLIISYLPQIIRIVRNQSSLGFSPWFLLLGATSSASSFLNIVALQWGIVRCCSEVSPGACAESMLGIVQVGLQWLMFIAILVLFLIYYPEELRYEHSISLSSRQRRSQSGFSINTNSSEHSNPSSIDSEDQEDLDSLDSHIANNYSTFSTQTPNESGLNLPSNSTHPSSSSGVPAKGLAARLRKEESNHNEAASSSAFSRLVPTFWPVWKAPEYSNDHDEDASAFTINNSSYIGTPNAPLNGVGGGGVPSSISGTPMGHNGPAGGSSFQKSNSNSGNALLAPLLKAKRKRRNKSTKQRTPEWSLALGMAWVTGIHFIFILAVTLLLVTSLPSSSFPTPSILTKSSRFNDYLLPFFSPFPGSGTFSSSSLFFINNSSSSSTIPTTAITTSTIETLVVPSSRLLVSRWATFLGVSGAILAAAQYIPQILHTLKAKLVGSLSIHMMLLQVPGSAIFVYSLAIRPGTDWTSLVAFICTGVLQLVLLILCFAWKLRQKKAGIDDFGRPIHGNNGEEERAIGDL